MAKSIDNATAVIIADIQSGDANPNQMLATEAVSLSDRGLIKLRLVVQISLIVILYFKH